MDIRTIKQIPSRNIGSDGEHGRAGFTPIAIVLHIMEGTMQGCDSWFCNPISGASTHYAISKRGEIHQYVAEEDWAWANGVRGNPTWPLITRRNPNLTTLSIEHEGYSGEPWTEAMYQADVWLIKDMAARWKIPLDRDHIIGHYEIDAVNRANCPGAGLDWDKLMGMLHA